MFSVMRIKFNLVLFYRRINSDLRCNIPLLLFFSYIQKNCFDFLQSQMKQGDKGLLDFSKIDNVCNHDMKKNRLSDYKTQNFYHCSIKLKISNVYGNNI